MAYRGLDLMRRGVLSPESVEGRAKLEPRLRDLERRSGALEEKERVLERGARTFGVTRR